MRWGLKADEMAANRELAVQPFDRRRRHARRREHLQRADSRLTPDAARREERRSRAARIFSHPLTITLVGGVLAAILLPLVTREWQDRQNELELKRALVERLAEASTTGVRNGISYVEQRLHAAPPGAKVDIATTYRKWLVERAVTRAVMATYFPSLEVCWYHYSNAITTLLELAPPQKRLPVRKIKGISNTLISADRDCRASARLPEAQEMRRDRLRTSLTEKGLLRPRTIGPRDTVRVTERALLNSYSDLGELLLIGKDGIVRQIVDTPARGYYHGIF